MSRVGTKSGRAFHYSPVTKSGSKQI